MAVTNSQVGRDGLSTQARKRYEAPKLVVLGDVAQITQGTGFGAFDVSSFGLAGGGGGHGGFS